MTLFTSFSNLIWMETGNGNLVTSFCIPNVVFNRYTGILFFFLFGNFSCVLLSRDLGNGTPHGIAQTIAHS